MKHGNAFLHSEAHAHYKLRFSNAEGKMMIRRKSFQIIHGSFVVILCCQSFGDVSSYVCSYYFSVRFGFDC